MSGVTNVEEIFGKNVFTLGKMNVCQRMCTRK